MIKHIGHVWRDPLAGNRVLFLFSRQPYDTIPVMLFVPPPLTSVTEENPKMALRDSYSVVGSSAIM
jgi:hypothetical protein